MWGIWACSLFLSLTECSLWVWWPASDHRGEWSTAPRPHSEEGDRGVVQGGTGGNQKERRNTSSLLIPFLTASILMFSVHPRYTCWRINGNEDISYSLLVHHLYIGTILLHTGREPTIRGWKKGSGTVWVSLFTYQNTLYQNIITYNYIKYLLKQPVSRFGGKLSPKSHTCFPSETKFLGSAKSFAMTFWHHMITYQYLWSCRTVWFYYPFCTICTYARLQLCKIFIDCVIVNILIKRYRIFYLPIIKA